MRSFLPLTLLLIGCGHVSARTEPATVDAASQAAFNSDYAKARTLYAEVSRSTSDASAREDAELALANIEWRIDRNADAARARLEALATRRSLLEASRMEIDYGRYAVAEALARKAIPLAQNTSERKAADLALVTAIVEGHVRARLAGTPAPGADLRQAFDLARRIVDEEHGRLRPSLLYLEAALILGEGNAALEAWKSYFDGAAASGLLAPITTALERLLPAWRGGASPEIASALAASRLFDAAVLAGASPEVVAWDGYIHRVQELTNAYYRDVANGRGHARSYQRELNALTLGVCETLGLACSDKTTQDDPGSPLYARFGALIQAGTTGSTFNLHFGHAVDDEKRQVTQYGRSATVRFVLLDTMVSNGFESWSWDGGSQHGGWADPGLIVQVRSAYAEGPVGQWEKLVDEDLKRSSDEDTARETEKDWSRAASDPYAYLPGLRMRLIRDAGLRLLDELHARGLSGAALREAFIADLGRRLTESSIFAHEGRHAIDVQSRPQWWTWLVGGSSQSEFQAKLSEITFAPDPKLAMTGGILVGNIGSESPHGVANRRIMKGIVTWMTAHQAEIAGLDPKRPLLPQLDRLTNDQLRVIARGIDPLAK